MEMPHPILLYESQKKDIVGQGTNVLYYTCELPTKLLRTSLAYRAEVLFSKASDGLFFVPFIKVENLP
jgi:hypothetical protein